jgi:E3 ubiquitin-protein ligase HERC3
MGDSLAAVSLGTGRSATAVACGWYHSCVILDDGRLKCFGWNGNGQLGQGDTSNRGDGPGEMGDSLAAVSLGTGRSATAVACGWSHSCVILDDGRLKCFGQSSSGELGLLTTFDRGDGPGEMGDFLPVVQLGSGVTAANVTLGQSFSCVTLSSGQLKCFGFNNYGQLGQGDVLTRGDGPGNMGDILPFVAVGTGRSIVAMSLGFDHSCVILDDGQLKCFG